MRFILYLGKGGVGKTTLAAATAARAAQMGRKTLVVSTDLAHSLADALDVDLTAPTPVQVRPNLWAHEINVFDEVRSHWARLQEYVSSTLKQQGINDVAAEEMAMVPGMDEIAALLNIYRQAQAGTYDVVVVDAAPTGETVRLLSMPETFLQYAGRTRGWRGAALAAARPLLKTVLPGINVLDTLDKLNHEVASLREVLTDGSASSYRLVVTPEKIVIKEALRAETYLALFGYPIDGVICNRVLPADDGQYHDQLLKDMLAQQRRYHEVIHTTFDPLPVWDAPYRTLEVIGPEALAELARDIWGDQDPVQIFHLGAVQEIRKYGSGYILRLPLPHVEMTKVGMVKKGDELIVEIGNFKRDISLPAMLASMNATVARMEDQALEVTFMPTAD